MASFADRRKFRGSSYTYPKTKSLGTNKEAIDCLLYTSPSPRDKRQSRMPSSA